LYISKLLRKWGVANVVFTDEHAYVMARDGAPLLIDQQLQDAGPCQYYMCLLQEFMSSGTLEDLAQAGGLSLAMMFKAMEDIAATLNEMHAHSVQHLDVKPENVMLVMKDSGIVAAKLCDLGRAEVGNNAKNRRDDVRRFGITLYSVAAGENWTQSRLLRADHSTLVSQLSEMVEDSKSDAVRRLPGVLDKLLNTQAEMSEAYAMIKELRQAYHDEIVIQEFLGGSK
jgi:serine/threonine protein kinase